MGAIEKTSLVDLMDLVQLKLPVLYRDLGQNFNSEDATYISERVAQLCASDLKIRACDVSIIGKAFDRLILKPISEKSNTTFKVSPKMIVSEISALAIALDEEKRNNFTADRAKQDAILSNFKTGSAETPTSKACLWKMAKMCDGYELGNLISIEEVARCFEEKLNPDSVFKEILMSAPKNYNIIKMKL